MPIPVMPRDWLVKQWLHKTRLRPHHILISNAAGYWGKDIYGTTIWVRRTRCPMCTMYNENCALFDERDGAQPGRLLKRANRLYTGTFHRFNRWDACGDPTGQFGYGRCRGKESQGQIGMGYLARERPIHPTWHSERTRLDSVSSEVFANAATAYGPINYANSLGNRDPYGTPPADHYDLCYRFKIQIPADATIVAAELLFWRTIPQTDTCYIRACLLDRDSMGAFSMSADDPNNPRRGNTLGPARLNVPGGDGNAYAIGIDNGGGGSWSCVKIPDEIIRPILQAFIARAGYAAGNYLGLSLDSDQALNTGLYNYIDVLAYDASGNGPVLQVQWREKNSPSHPTFGSPPKLVGYQQFMQKATVVPPEGTWPAEKYGVDAGQVVTNGAATKIPDQAWANAYRHCFYIPVDPLASWWNQEEFGDAPYPADAHQNFPLNDCETYEVPCFTRRSPYRYVGLGTQTVPHIAGGLRGIVGFSSEPARHGFMPVYALGCQLGGLSYLGLDESTWRRYWGMTRAKRFLWSADPQGRGWFVEYTAYIRAWYVQDADFEHVCEPAADHVGLPDGCMFRWNTWYQIDIRAAFPPQADLGDPEFRAWVLEHDAGFGAVVTPRYAHCNDVLRRCAGIRQAMGDQLYPPEACQDDMGLNGVTQAAETQYAPCQHEDGAYSWWYLPDTVSNHVKSPTAGPRIGAYPERALYHETKMVRELTPVAGSQTEEKFGWAILGFMTNQPWLLSVDSGVEVLNEIHRITISNPNACEDPPSDGTWKVGYDGEPDWTLECGYAATASEVQTAIEAAYSIGAGNLAVTGPDGGPYELEYIGDLAGRPHALPVKQYCNVHSASECVYDLQIEQVQQATGRSS